MKATTRMLMVLAAAAVTAGAGENLVLNGSFDDAADPLKGWTYDYTWTGNKLYADNHKLVAVIPSDGPKSGVLKISATRYLLFERGQGVKVDSAPVPFEPGAAYKCSLWARSEVKNQSGESGGGKRGPDARIYIEGYQWKPGVKPHENPSLSELRVIYRQGGGRMLYLGAKAGAFSGVSSQWKKGDCVFPDPDASADAQAILKRIKFIVVHICALDGWDGDLLIDEVVLEKTGRAAGADTRKKERGG